MLVESNQIKTFYWLLDFERIINIVNYTLQETAAKFPEFAVNELYTQSDCDYLSCLGYSEFNTTNDYDVRTGTHG